RGHRGALLHDGAGEGRRRLRGAEAAERRPRHGRERVEGGVADQLQPDLGAQVVLDGALEAAADERFRDRPAGVGALPARRPDGEPRPLEVADDAGRDDLGRAVDDAADDVLRRDRAGDDAARVDALERAPAKLAVDALEVPPGYAVLREDDRRV